jgi:hypothetical protein
MTSNKSFKPWAGFSACSSVRESKVGVEQVIHHAKGAMSDGSGQPQHATLQSDKTQPYEVLGFCA